MHELPLTQNSSPASPATKGTYSLVTLGCPKNLVDSERMLGLLKLDGYQLVRQPEGADFVVINTCGFLQAARKESLETIREMIRLKEGGKLRGVIVTGCLVERNKDRLLEECPGIDQIVGVFGRDEITHAADRLIGGLTEQRTVFRPAPAKPLPDSDRLRITPPHVAYLKISEGCDRNCTFCTIPSIRGKHVTKPIEEVVAEAQQLAAEGVRELVIVAQDTTYYGLDLYSEPRLAELLAKLEEIGSIEWIRLMYLYPMYFTEPLFELLGSSRKVLPYLDLPLQHIDDKILRRMNRRADRGQTEALLDRLRAGVPNLVLRTTMITGFPGESEAQFQELLDFVTARRFERLGVFAYSKEPDTPAVRLSEPVPPRVARARRDRLMAIQQEIAFAWSEAQVGRRLEILLDSCIPNEKNAYIGRSYADAPEIDGAVYVTGEGLKPGQIVPCEVVAARGYDLIAAAIGDPR
jgi:ribosomal protein S12 methylthiotransferase